MTRARSRTGALVLAVVAAAALGACGKGSASTLHPATGGSPSPAASSPVVSPSPTVTPPPHFATPEAAMRYLAAAWNANDPVALRHVTNPAARDLLQNMHSEAVDLRLDHCSRRPQGDYQCVFLHNYPAAMHKPGIGFAYFLVGPARTPGWYMTVFEGCG